MASPRDSLDLRLIARLREQANDVRRLTSGLREEALARRVIHDKWSLKELVCHLHRVQQIFRGRVEALLREDNPNITPYEPEGDEGFEKLAARPANETLMAFLADREGFLEVLERLGPADWRRKGNHPEYRDFDVRFQVEYMMFHEAHHLYQMYQRRALPAETPQ